MRFTFLSILISNFIRPNIVFILFIYSTTLSYTSSANSGVQFYSKRHGSVQIQGIFPNSLHYNPKTSRCSRFSPENIQLTQAMIYTIDYLINNNPTLLPGIEIGYKILDSCSSRHLAVSSLTSSLVESETVNFLQFGDNGTLISDHTSVSGHVPTIGIVAEKIESITIALASYTSSLYFPQISYNSFSTLLNDRNIFPYFFRTTSPLAVQAQAISDIVSYFNWNWISIVIGGLDTFINVEKILTSAIKSRNICISLTITLYANHTQFDLHKAVSRLKRQHRSNVIILIGDEAVVHSFLEVAQTRNLTGRTFIGTYSWLKSSRLSNISGDILGGALGIDISGRSLKAYMKYLQDLDLCNNANNPWFKAAWYEKLTLAGYKQNGKLSTTSCSLNHRLKVTLFSKFYETNHIAEFVMDAVLALAYTLHDSLGCNSSYCPSFHPNFITNNHAEFVRALRNVSFQGVTTNKFRFRRDGSSQLTYQVINLQPFKNATVNTVIKTKIGSWNEKMGLSINYNEIIWNGGKKWDNIPISRCSDDCRPGYAVASGQYSNFQLLQCCWRCKKCKDQTISDTINQGSCEKCVNFTEANQNHTLCIDMPIAEINSRGSVAVILYLFTAFYLICWIFIYSTIVIYRKTPIIKASNFALLNIFQFFNLLSLPASLLSVLPITSIICAAQTILIALSEIGQLLTIICRANQIAIVFKKSLRRSRWRSTFVRNRSQVLFIILVSALSQLTIAALLIYRPVLVTKVINANNKIEMMCSYINNPALLVYGILFGLLNIIALVLAIQTRSLPDNYNEARYILLSAMMFTCVFSTSLPSILATTGLTNRKITSFSLFSTGVISMLCFLLPKMYIIYIHPEMNTPSQAAASVANYNFNHRGLVTPTSYQENSAASLLSSSVEPYRMKASPTQIQSNNDRKSTNNKDT